MTTEELLALPDDGVERGLIRGSLRENRMIDTRLRTPAHAGAMSGVSGLLGDWLRRSDAPKGKLFAGALCRLNAHPDTAVTIDVVFIPQNVAERIAQNASYIDGVPRLAVEILSPADTVGDIAENIDIYLKCGIALVWVVDPDFQTVTVHQSGADPQFFNRNQVLSAEPQMPGLRINVAEIFD